MLQTIRAAISAQLTETLALDPIVTVSTSGPAGIQVGRFPGEAAGLTVFLLIPAASELAENLASGQKMVVTTSAWQATGLPRCVTAGEIPAGLHLAGHPDLRWCKIAAVAIVQFEKYHPQGWGTSESYDLE